LPLSPFSFFYSLLFLSSFFLFILSFYFHFFLYMFHPCYWIISFTLLSFSLFSHSFITHIRVKDSGLSFMHTCSAINMAPRQTTVTTLWSKRVAL
jgi:hypothetical protein